MQSLVIAPDDRATLPSMMKTRNAILIVGGILLLAAVTVATAATLRLSDGDEFRARVAAVCTTGSPARLDLDDMASICRDAQR